MFLLIRTISKALVIVLCLSFYSFVNAGSLVKANSDQWYVSPLISLVKPALKNEWSQASLTSDFKGETTQGLGLVIGVDRGKYRSNMTLRMINWTNAGLKSVFFNYERPYPLNQFFKLNTLPAISNVQISAGLGLGYGQFNNELIDATAGGLGFNLFAGLSKPITKQWHVFSNVAYQYYGIETAQTNDEGNKQTVTLQGAPMLELGVRYYITQQKTKLIIAQVHQPKPKPIVIDTDGDGVSDNVDQCKFTPENTVIDRVGCELGDDRDGIKNSKDQCSNTIPNVTVNNIGCEFDDDNDGIVDSQDICANTPVGLGVNAKGCIFFEGVIDGLSFQLGMLEITKASKQILNKLLHYFIDFRSLKVEVLAHTDNQGEESYNKKLSEERAAIVVEYFVSRGLDRSRITGRGMGELSPIADNATVSGRALNRRVEFNIVRD